MVFYENAKQEWIRPNGCIYEYHNTYIIYSVLYRSIFIWDKVINECIKIIPIDEKNNSWLYVNLIRIDNELYFIPYQAEYMLRYNLINEKIEKIAVRFGDNEENYHKSIFFKGNIYMFPVTGSTVLIYDIKTGKIRYFNCSIPEYKEADEFFDKIYFASNCVWIVTGKDRKVYCYNLERNDCKTYFVKNKCGNIVDVTGKKEQLFLLSDDGSVILLDIESGLERLIFKESKQVHKPYLKLHYCLDEIWLVPFKSDYIKVIDLDGKEIKKWNVAYLRQSSNGRLFEESLVQNDFIFICTFSRKILVANKLDIEILNFDVGFIQVFDILFQYTKSDENRKSEIGANIWKVTSNH